MTGRLPTPGPAARRVLGGTTIAYGAAVGFWGPRFVNGKAVAVVRVLAIRYVLQGIAVSSGGAHWARLAGLADATHAVTMVPLALRPRYRVAALAGAATAAGLARASWWAAG